MWQRFWRSASRCSQVSNSFSLGSDTVVGIVGAGAMGGGIAQVAASAGHRVVLYDARPDAAGKAVDAIGKTLQRLVEKQKIKADAAHAAVSRLSVATAEDGDFSAFASCGLVIEAIVEDLDVKRRTFASLERAVSDTCVLATNTSSLSVTAIARACGCP